MADTSGPVRGSRSLFSYRQFQNAYVTNDLDRAVAMLCDIFGIKEFRYTRDFAMSIGGSADVAMAWAGDVVIEILQGKGNPDSLYQRHLRTQQFDIRFHHFGYLVSDQAAWNELTETIARDGRTVPFEGAVPDLLSWIYVEIPELGHYLEYVMPCEAFLASLDDLPRY